ncbi:MAG: hypothetical protein U0441_36170 [Polyangiaceae bacterium]
MSVRSLIGFMTSALPAVGSLALLATACTSSPPKDPSSASPASGAPAMIGKCSEAGYCWESPVPQPTLLGAAWAAGPNDIYVAGASERILHFDGTKWTIENEGEGWIDDLWGSGPDSVFAVGADGMIRHRTGGKWQSEDVESTNNFEAVWGTGPNDVFAVGDRGLVFHHDGKSWSGQTTSSEARLTAVWGNGPKEVYAVGTVNGVGGEVLLYDGRDWKKRAAFGASLEGVWGDGKGHVWVAGVDAKDRPTVWTLDKSKDDWTSTNVGGKGQILGFSGASGRPALLVYEDVSPSNMVTYLRGQVRAYEPSEKGWTGRDLVIVSSPLGQPGWGFTSVGKDTLLVAGWWGIVGTVPSGAPARAGEQALSLMTGNPVLGRNLNAVWGTSANDVVAVGVSGAMLHYDGRAWTPDPAGKDYDLDAIHGAKGALVTVGRRGVMLVRKGGVWSEVKTGTSADLHGVWTDGDQTFACGDAGLILRCDAAGCAPMESSTKKDLWEIHGTSAQDLVATGSDKVALRRSGDAWKMMLVPNDGFSAIGPDGSGDLIASTFDATYRMEQGSWVRVAQAGHGAAGGYWAIAPLGEREAIGIYGGGGAPIGARRWTGTKWLEEPLPGGRDDLGAGVPRGVWTSGGEVFIVGSGGVILHKKSVR